MTTRKAKPKKYSLSQIDRRLNQRFWSPLTVANINDWVLRAAAVKGEFHWHKHNDDEFFLVYKGQLTIETDSGVVRLKRNEGVVIPKGLKHKPHTSRRAVVLLLEPKRLNTKGD